MSTTASAPGLPETPAHIVAFPTLSVPLDRRRMAAAGRAHSHVVRTLRMILPVLALAVVAAVLLWPQKQTLGPQALFLHATATGGLGGDAPQMLNPRLVSVGADAKPLHIRAIRALQPRGPNGPIVLESPQAELILRNGSTATIAAGSATVFPDRPEDILLEDGIRFVDKDGNTLSGETLTVDTARQTAFSREPVKARFGSGALSADGITISEGGASIRFQGRTTTQMTADPHSTAVGD